MLPGLVKVEECSQMRGRVLPAVAEFLEPIYTIFTQGSFAPVSTLDGPEGEGMVWRLSLGSSEEVSRGLGKFESRPRGPGGQPTSPHMGRRIGLVQPVFT